MIRQLTLQQSTILRSSINYQRSLLSTSLRTNYSVIDSAKKVLSKANKKIGEVAAEGIEKAEHIVPKHTHLSDAAKTAKDKTGEAFADAARKAERTIPTSREDVAKKRVNDNIKGYKDLQDKGSKVESEQNRPEDGF